MTFKNIKSTDGNTIHITCQEKTCETCGYLKIFEFPWRVPIEVLDGEKCILDFRYCKVFSRLAKVYEMDALLPEPLDVDKENNCLRHEKCLRSEIPFPEERKVEDED